LDSISEKEMVAVDGELVLIDNNSTDETRQIMDNYEKGAGFPVVVCHEPNSGLSRARNKGLMISCGELIVFTDDDCYMESGYLLEASRLFETGDFDYASGQTVLYDKSDAKVGYNIFYCQSILKPNTFIPAGSVQGSNMIFRRRVINKIGDFDPMLGAGTEFPSEDIDYAARAAYAGFTGAKLPQLVIYHDHGRKPGKHLKDILKTYDYGRGAYYAKYILQGRFSFLFHWIRQSSFEMNRNIINEMTGAFKYIMKQIRE
jgi:glycosyltransferase involved in cell wall biosynthesis